MSREKACMFVATVAVVLAERRCRRVLSQARHSQREMLATLGAADGLLRDARALVGEWQAEETAAVNREAGA